MLLGVFEQYRRVWIETTKTSHEHGGLGWEFGTCLWSPSTDKSGKNTYFLMREVKKDDLVFHFLKDDLKSRPAFALCGFSYVDGPCQEIFTPPPNPGKWAGRPSYFRVPLTNFVHTQTPVAAKVIFGMYGNELTEDCVSSAVRHYPFCTGKRGLKFNQGRYISQCTSSLFHALRKCLGSGFQTRQTIKTVSSLLAYEEGQRAIHETSFFVRNKRLRPALLQKRGYTCEVCGVDYIARFGLCGISVIECHHLNPLAERPPEQMQDSLYTEFDQMAVVCANCHRLIHSAKPALDLNEARRIVFAELEVRP